MGTSGSEVIYLQHQGEARVINVLIIHYLKIMILKSIILNCFMYLSEREGDGVFNPFRTSVHEKCTMEHCFCIFNYLIMFPLSKKLPQHQQSFLTI